MRFAQDFHRKVHIERRKVLGKAKSSIKPLVKRYVFGAVALVLIVTSAGALSAQQAGKTEKMTVIHQVARKWMAVGQEQYNRGLYAQAEQSLLYALDYREYLTGSEHKVLSGLLANARAGVAERKSITEDIKKAEELIEQAMLLDARAKLEKIQAAASLSENQQKLVEKNLKKINDRLKKLQQQIARLYERSMKFYRKQQFEKVRECFAQIDSILAEITRPLVQIKKEPAEQIDEEASASALEAVEQQEVDKSFWTEALEEQSPRFESESVVETERHLSRQAPDGLDVLSAAEPLTSKPVQPHKGLRRKEKIVRSYTNAVVGDAIANAQRYAGEGRLAEAQAALEAAKMTINQNREYLGEDIFERYNLRLEQLSKSLR